MTQVSKSVKNQIVSVLEEKITDWYPTLQEILNTDDVPILFDSNWRRYIKSVKCTLEWDSENAFVKQSVDLDVWFYPNIDPFLSIGTVNFSDLFNVSEDLIDVLKSELIDLLEPSVRLAISELILLVLESKDRKLPPLEDIKARIRDNLDTFLKKALDNYIEILSVAPIMGCEVNEAVEVNGLVLRKPTRSDVAVMYIAKGLSAFSMYSGTVMPRSCPVLVLRHKVVKPNVYLNKYRKYDVDLHNYKIHKSFKDTASKILAALRLCAERPVGYGLVYHIEEPVTPTSLRVVTEEPHPQYRITSSCEVNGRRYVRPSLFDKVVVDDKCIKEIYREIVNLSNGKSVMLLSAINYYSKSMENFEIFPAVLCLTNSLEALCNYLEGENGSYTTGNKITKVLNKHVSLSKMDKNSIKDFYEIRSRIIAHQYKYRGAKKRHHLYLDLRWENLLVLKYEYENEYNEIIKFYNLVRRIILDIFKQKAK